MGVVDVSGSGLADPSGQFTEIALPAEAASVGRARRIVAEQWRDLDSEVLGDVELIVSELVTNALRHGSPNIALRLRRASFAVDVAVLDHGPGVPTKRDAEDTAAGGRGLAIIERLALSWGCEPLSTSEGKIVWASIDSA